MTIDEANKWLDRIQKASDDCDNELAHSLEDEFREIVLSEISKGSSNSVELAILALQTNDIDFERWYS